MHLCPFLVHKAKPVRKQLSMLTCQSACCGVKAPQGTSVSSSDALTPCQPCAILFYSIGNCFDQIEVPSRSVTELSGVRFRNYPCTGGLQLMSQSEGPTLCMSSLQMTRREGCSDTEFSLLQWRSNLRPLAPEACRQCANH